MGIRIYQARNKRAVLALYFYFIHRFKSHFKQRIYRGRVLDPHTPFFSDKGKKKHKIIFKVLFFIKAGTSIYFNF